MTISAFPTPTPSRSQDQDTFDSAVEAFLTHLPTFVSEANAVAVAMNLNSTIDTSTSSVAIGTGAKTFTVTAGKSFQPGMWLVIADTAAPTTNAMFAQVTSYSGTTLVVNSYAVMGSGTKTAWVISQSAPAALEGLYALVAGSATQAFSVAAATAAAHAPQIAQTIGKNICVNPAFQVNQLEYVSGAALASGSYGHDQWKAGTGGGDYSFTQNFASTTITIAAGKTLIQAFAPENVNSTSFVVSWTGTAQCRIGVNTATPAGSYAASPVLITGQTVGAAMSIEFNAGTLGEVMVDEGAIVRSMPEHRYADVLAECQRYLPTFASESASSFISSAFAYDATTVLGTVVFPERARIAPTGIVVSNVAHFATVTGVTGNTASAVAMSTPSRHGAILQLTVAAVTQGQGGEVYFNNSAGRLFFTGCQV